MAAKPSATMGPAPAATDGAEPEPKGIEPLSLTDAIYWSFLDDLEELAQRPDFRDEFEKWKEERE